MSRGCWVAIFKLLGSGEGKCLLTLLELGRKEFLLALNWNKGIFPGDSVFAFLYDCGLVKIWKLSTGIKRIDQNRLCFFSSECTKGKTKSNCSGLDRECNTPKIRKNLNFFLWH